MKLRGLHFCLMVSYSIYHAKHTKGLIYLLNYTCFHHGWPNILNFSREMRMPAIPCCGVNTSIICQLIQSPEKKPARNEWLFTSADPPDCTKRQKKRGIRSCCPLYIAQVAAPKTLLELRRRNPNGKLRLGLLVLPHQSWQNLIP